ncbi:sensor histidine kinase [Actinomadura macrotermitis]|uniref:histidine kinase n=1 Tax=Actinomadura macrotermitis TaxID=2585200 RepID=A0A7K0BRA9_9ACTN|nr:HAMP domain-containing sensor histidine kinase [Actinomadura macrotermitis]MQY03657.1 Adaptive-response sensory-kinase SasA [Actinomadura macrotermitis]
MRRPAHWSLRSRLALMATLLSAAGLLAANTAGLLLLRHYLVGQVDRRLSQMTEGPLSQNVDRLRLLRGVLRNAAPRQVPGLDGENLRIYLVEGGRADPVVPEGADLPGPDLPGRAALDRRAGGGAFTVPGKGGSARWRVQVVRGDAGALVAAASSLALVDDTFQGLLVIDAVVMAVVLATLSLLARFLAGVGLRPLSRMAVTAGEIAAGDYTRRVAGADPHTEPGRLGRAVNTMLGTVEREINARKASEARMRRFLADASHELRTPLTSIRGFAELARRGGSPGDALRRIEDEAARMGVLVDDLLLLARLDEQRPAGQAPVDLLELAADLVRDVHLRHPGRRVTLTGLDPGEELFEPVVVAGDALRLRQVVRNLLDNAVRHTPEGTRVTVRVGSDGGAAVVAVADTGPGIAAPDVPHVFDRLYRADRSRTSDGSGLGLAIARAITEAHGGRLVLTETPGGGATFTMTIPRRR